MIYINILRTKDHNPHYLNRYIKLIEKWKHKNSSGHKHHICPKAKDMFPEYSQEHSWNIIVVTPREHFILHWILAKAYPGTSQTLAFFYMSNAGNKIKGKDYEQARLLQAEKAKITCKNSERNAKISAALRNKPKSEEHKAKLLGHKVSQETRQKLRQANLGKRHSEESKQKMSASRTGKPTKPHTDEGKENIAASKMQDVLVTPKGFFITFKEVADAYNIPLNKATNIFRCLDNKPKPATLAMLGIEYTTPKTYRQLGFNRKPIV